MTIEVRWNFFSGKCGMLPVIRKSALDSKAHSKKALSAGSLRHIIYDNLRDDAQSPALSVDRNSLTLAWFKFLNLPRPKTSSYSAKIFSVTQSLQSPRRIREMIRAGLLSGLRRAEIRSSFLTHKSPFYIINPPQNEFLLLFY